MIWHKFFDELPQQNGLLLVSDGVVVFSAYWYTPHGLTQINPLLRNGTEPKSFHYWVYVKELLDGISTIDSD